MENMELTDFTMQDMFFKDNFNVDECLSKYTHKADLETLRKELKIYGGELQQQMSEILKTETEGIVNLAEHLTNLQNKIENLQLPISQLQEEILTLHNLTNTVEKSYGTLLRNIKNNNTMQGNIQLKQGILTSSSYIENSLRTSQESSPNLLELEHIVNKFSFQKYYMEVLNIITPDIDEIIKRIEHKLIEIINDNFLKSFKTNNIDILTRCLRLCNNLGKQTVAYDTFRIKIVKPFLEKVLTEKNLVNLQQNLELIYNEVLTFIDKEMAILHQVIKENPDFATYNFVLSSFWKEFDRQSRLSLPYITAPGNPELFRTRFGSTFHMLQKIAIRCGDDCLVRNDETFQEHLNRFNLPVYFEIQYQKIAGVFESEILIEKSKMYAEQNPLSCKLKPTLALYVAISQCFQEEVYIDQLANQFLKLSFMLLSRYLKWYNEQLQESSFPNNAAWEIFIMDALHDLNLVKDFVALNVENEQDIQNTLFHIVNQNMRSVIAKTFRVNAKCITDTQNKLKDHLVHLKLQDSLGHLQQVGAIPRLYRKTNRTAPKDASQYVVEAVKPVLQFQKKFISVQPMESEDILKQIIHKMTNQYHMLVQEVLKSVCKTESSLRRLKNRNVSATEDTSAQTDTISDEMKIREQIKLDVNYFCEKVQSCASEDTKATLEILKTEI